MQRCPNSHTWLLHLHLPAPPPFSVHVPAEPALQSASLLQWHAHVLHVKPAGHWSPQPPQFGTDVCVLVSQPLFGRLSQLPKPELQLGVQTPLGHVVVPFAFVH